MSFHLFHINEVYSDSTGRVQYVELVGDSGGQNVWSGKKLVSTNGVDTLTYTFPTNLPSSLTAGKSVLVATQGYADLGLATPNFIVPDEQFLFLPDGTVKFQNADGSTIVDALDYTNLPNDGISAFNSLGNSVLNSPLNFAGINGTIPGTPILGGAFVDGLNGSDGKDFIVTLGGDDVASGNGDNDTIKGGTGNDSLDGGAGNDHLIGEGGNDTLIGGAGNDVFVRNGAGDVLLEDAEGGTDLVQSSLTCILDANFENLTLTGANAINGTGNSAVNTLTGNSAANTLQGGGGNDVLRGAGGNDILNGGSGADKLFGDAGNDTLVWGAGDILNGGSGTLDKLRVAVASLDLSNNTANPNTRLLNFEQVDLRSGAHTLKIAQADVLDMSSTSTITILGDSADTVDIVGAQVAGGSAPVGFDRYTIGTAILIIDEDINVV